MTHGGDLENMSSLALVKRKENGWVSRSFNFVLRYCFSLIIIIIIIIIMRSRITEQRKSLSARNEEQYIISSHLISYPHTPFSSLLMANPFSINLTINPFVSGISLSPIFCPLTSSSVAQT